MKKSQKTYVAPDICMYELQVEAGIANTTFSTPGAPADIYYDPSADSSDF